jgi:tetratricopeptide (TPR) repeat protein
MDLPERLHTLLGSRYAVERELGCGGMAVVYLARDERFDRPVAIKVLRPEIAASLGSERFLREIDIAAKFQHPNIVPLFDSGAVDGLLYYVMPFIEGESLADRLGHETQLSLVEALAITKDVAAALTYSHRHGVVHRDIKPHNIMLTGDRAVVTDFGVAHALEQSAGERLSETGMAIGTPEYMSPEQAAGVTKVDGRSDIYSLGCVLYEMLSGDPPFTGRTPQAILARQMQERTPSLEVVRPELPVAVFDVVERALAKVPAERFQSVEELSQALDAVQSAERLRIRPSRWRSRVGALALAAAVALTAWFGWDLMNGPSVPLSEARMMAFPIEVSGASGDAGPDLGVDIVTAMAGVLDGWGEMRWLDARDFLDPEDRTDPSRMTLEAKRRVAIAHGAAHFTSGRLIVGPDSARLFLDLYHVSQLEPVDRTRVAGPPREYLPLGLEAAPTLLLSLLPEDQAAEVASIRGRSSPAIQAFVRGELAYRRGQYRDAMRRFEAALEEDSLFALAAFKAASAAVLTDTLRYAARFLQPALRGVERLAPRDRSMVFGLRHYLAGDADSALAYLRAARDMDDRRPDAWLAIGLVYRHLIPMEPDQDSLALATFRQAYALSPDFAPVLLYLGSRSARDGDLVSARARLAEVRRVDPDPTELAKLELEVDCASHSPGTIDWQARVLENVNVVFQMARDFHIALSHPACAEAGWNAVVEYDTTSLEAFGFSASVGLQSLLAAQGRTEELRAWLDSVPWNQARWLFIVDALAGLDLAPSAETAAADIRASLWPDRSTRLWPLAVWDVRIGQLSEARTIRDTLEARAARAGSSSVDTLLWRSVAAHVMLAEGDTVSAMDAFRVLRPTAPRPALTWQPWLSLGYDWLVLAELLALRGEDEEALRILTIAEAPASAANLIFRPAMMALRERIINRQDR